MLCLHWFNARVDVESCLHNKSFDSQHFNLILEPYNKEIFFLNKL